MSLPPMSNESEIARWVDGLESLRGELSEGDSFFRVHEERYLAIARNVGGQALLALTPEGIDANDWRDRVAEFQELVFSRLTGSGLEIIYAGRSEEDAKGTRQVKITYDDVLEWVRAGPENGGKDKTIIEQTRGKKDGRADEHITYNVYEAIEQQRLGTAMKDYSGILKRLEEWVENRVLSGDFADLLVVVLDAWLEAVAVAAERDLADWVDEAIEDGFR